MSAFTNEQKIQTRLFAELNRKGAADVPCHCTGRSLADFAVKQRTPAVSKICESAAADEQMNANGGSRREAVPRQSRLKFGLCEKNRPDWRGTPTGGNYAVRSVSGMTAKADGNKFADLFDTAKSC